MKMHLYITFFLTLTFAFESHAQLPNLKKGLEKTGLSLPGSNSLSQDEIGAGLKEALNRGIEAGVNK